MDPADATSIVSIAGAMCYPGKELPRIAINGDYVRTSHIVNGYPVYVKINGQQWSVPPEGDGFSEAERTEMCCNNTTNRICIMMNVECSEWCLKDNGVPEDPVCMSVISIPRGAASKHLEDLATQHTLELGGYEEATVSLKSIADTMAGIAAAATTHAQRRGISLKTFECQTCGEKPFCDFVVLQCGHALFCRECHERHVAYLANGGVGRRTCSSGCSVLVSMYNSVLEHSDFAPLYMADPSADAEPSDAADTQPGAATRATGNRFAVTVGTVGTGCARIVAL